MLLRSKPTAVVSQLMAIEECRAEGIFLGLQQRFSRELVFFFSFIFLSPRNVSGLSAHSTTIPLPVQDRLLLWLLVDVVGGSWGLWKSSILAPSCGISGWYRLISPFQQHHWAIQEGSWAPGIGCEWPKIGPGHPGGQRLLHLASKSQEKAEVRWENRKPGGREGWSPQVFNFQRSIWGQESMVTASHRKTRGLSFEKEIPHFAILSHEQGKEQRQKQPLSFWNFSRNTNFKNIDDWGLF